MRPKKVSESNKPRRRAVRVTIEEKKNIIAKHESGVRLSDLAIQYAMPKSSVCTILKNKEAIKAADVAKGVTVITKQRSQTVEEVEKLLLTWLNEKQLAGERLSENNICEKAKQLHADLIKNTPGTSANNNSFKASRGWLEKFRRRSGIHRNNNPLFHVPHHLPLTSLDRSTDQEQTRFEDQSSSEQRPDCVQHTERLRKGSCTSDKSFELNHIELGIEPPLGNLEPKKEITDEIEIKAEEEDLCTWNDEVSNSLTEDPLEVTSSTCFPSADHLKDDCNNSNSMPATKKMKMDIDHQLSSYLQAGEGDENPPQYIRTAKMVAKLLATLSPSAQLQMTAEVMEFIVERLPHYKDK